ncbi:MAG: tyrosine-type recombinase/integrase [Bacteroidaceae bacterium]|nr:tyrosine-type recombinase/integrase [Bacteroidaceae bacterium]
MFIDSFIGHLRAEMNCSLHTLRAYAADLRSFQEYMSGTDESLTFFNADTDVVRSWVASLMDSGAAPSSVSRKLSSLRTFYQYLQVGNPAVSNPVASLQGPKRRKKLPVFVKESEMDELIDEHSFGEGYLPCRDRMILVLFYETGLRLSELVGLDVADVDMNASLVKVCGKRNKERIIPFASELKRELSEYLVARNAFAGSDSGALFLSSRGGRVSASQVYRMVRLQLSNVTSIKKKSPHVLRHSFATAMLNNDAEIGAVKELLGHERLATTEIYTHLTFQELKRFYDKAHPRAGNN